MIHHAEYWFSYPQSWRTVLLTLLGSWHLPDGMDYFKATLSAAGRVNKISSIKQVIRCNFFLADEVNVQLYNSLITHITWSYRYLYMWTLIRFICKHFYMPYHTKYKKILPLIALPHCRKENGTQMSTYKQTQVWISAIDTTPCYFIGSHCTVYFVHNFSSDSLQESSHSPCPQLLL